MTEISGAVREKLSTLTTRTKITYLTEKSQGTGMVCSPFFLLSSWPWCLVCAAFPSCPQNSRETKEARQLYFYWITVQVSDTGAQSSEVAFSSANGTEATCSLVGLNCLSDVEGSSHNTYNIPSTQLWGKWPQWPRCSLSITVYVKMQKLSFILAGYEQILVSHAIRIQVGSQNGA